MSRLSSVALATKGDDHLDWADVMRDLDELTATEGKRLLLRSEAERTRSKTYQAAGVGLPPTAWLTPSAQT